MPPDLGAAPPVILSRIGDWLTALRMHQWSKNLLVFVPLFAAHQYQYATAITQTLIATACFCLCASGAYLINDMIDAASDRQHRTKADRPFAAKRLPVAHGVLVAPALVILGISLATFLPPAFALILGGYVLLTLSYSLLIKRLIVIDVAMLATLYTLRIVAGAAAISVPLSAWLIAFSAFLFTSLALVKRHTELTAHTFDDPETALPGRGYAPVHLGAILTVGVITGLMSALTLALYVLSDASAALYTGRNYLWIASPLLLAWVLRMWLLAHRQQMHDDPVVFAMTDKTSLLIGVLITCVYWMAL